MASFENTADRGRGQQERGGGREGGGRERARAPRRSVAVSEVSQLTPHMIRVIIGGELNDWDVTIPGGHFKLFVPRGEEAAMRTYTVRAYDPEAARLTVDFAIHAGGPATSWAQSATPGDTFQVSGQARAGYLPGESADWTVFLADQSALPAVAAALEMLPTGYRVRALIEIPSEDEKLELTSAADVQIDWIIESDVPCQRLVEAASLLELPAGDGEVCVGCEANAMRQIRGQMLHQRQLQPRALHTRAYWKRDVANHSDHDTGEDVD
jgi:NADPH-dependent ferric siderophore reductase